MKLYLCATIILGASALAGCNATAGKTDTAAIEKSIKDIETQWKADYAARDIDALAGHYVADAGLGNPGAALATDDATRREGIQSFIADPTLKLDFASDRIQVAESGDLAYSRGHYTSEGTDPATKKLRKDQGSYLTVWRKQADGGWKAVEDFTTPGAPIVAQ